MGDLLQELSCGLSYSQQNNRFETSSCHKVSSQLSSQTLVVAIALQSIADRDQGNVCDNYADCGQVACRLFQGNEDEQFDAHSSGLNFRKLFAVIVLLNFRKLFAVIVIVL